MISTNIVIKDRATVQSIGEHTNRNCEPVVCLTENKIFNSVVDTASYYDVSESQISKMCNGKAKTCHKMKFCFLRDIDQHLDEIMENNRRNTENERKAALWDAYQKEQEAARKAEEERQQAIAKAKAKIERREQIRRNAYQKYLMAEGRLAEAERELKDLEGGESK